MPAISETVETTVAASVDGNGVDLVTTAVVVVILADTAAVAESVTTTVRATLTVGARGASLSDRRYRR